VQQRVVREIRTLGALWETGFSLKIYAPALDPTEMLVCAASTRITQRKSSGNAATIDRGCEPSAVERAKPTAAARAIAR